MEIVRKMTSDLDPFRCSRNDRISMRLKLHDSKVFYSSLAFTTYCHDRVAGSLSVTRALGDAYLKCKSLRYFQM